MSDLAAPFPSKEAFRMYLEQSPDEFEEGATNLDRLRDAFTELCFENDFRTIEYREGNFEVEGQYGSYTYPLPDWAKEYLSQANPFVPDEDE